MAKPTLKLVWAACVPLVRSALSGRNRRAWSITVVATMFFLLVLCTGLFAQSQAKIHALERALTEGRAYPCLNIGSRCVLQGDSLKCLEHYQEGLENILHAGNKKDIGFRYQRVGRPNTKG
jgi:hypothetical protein